MGRLCQSIPFLSPSKFGFGAGCLDLMIRFGGALVFLRNQLLPNMIIPPFGNRGPRLWRPPAMHCSSQLTDHAPMASIRAEVLIQTHNLVVALKSTFQPCYRLLFTAAKVLIFRFCIFEMQGWALLHCDMVSLDRNAETASLLAGVWLRTSNPALTPQWWVPRALGCPHFWKLVDLAKILVNSLGVGLEWIQRDFWWSELQDKRSTILLGWKNVSHSINKGSWNSFFEVDELSFTRKWFCL